MEDPLEAFHDDEVSQRVPCPVCQRQFNEDVLTRHVGICEKSMKKRRKPFNSQKQRWMGSGVQVETVKKPSEPSKLPAPKKSNWKDKHEAFLASIRAARGDGSEKDKLGNNAKPTKIVNPDYVQCPHCERRFNEHSATRHIEFCKEQKSRIASKKAGPKDLTKLAKRTQYKPPLPGKKKSVDSPSSANSPQRRISSPKYGIGNYVPSSAEKDFNPTTEKLKKQSALRRTQSNEVPDTRKEQTVSKRRSSSLIGNNNKRKNELDSPKKTAVNGIASPKGNHVPQDELFHDEDISRAALGNRRNRGGHASSGVSQNTNGQITTSAGRRKTHDQRVHYGLEGDGSGSGDERTISSGRRKGSRHNSPSSVSRTESGISVGSGGREGSATKLSKFCYECGTKYPVAHAKYCCECGVKRVHIDI